MAEENNHAIKNAKAWLDTIIEYWRAHKALAEDNAESAEADGETYETDDALLDRVHEAPLSVQVREGWKDPGAEGEAEEFNILLSTGGPALRIIGDLGAGNVPESPKLQWSDWGQPWTDYHSDLDDAEDALQWFCEQFYYGE